MESNCSYIFLFSFKKYDISLKKGITYKYKTLQLYMAIG